MRSFHILEIKKFMNILLTGKYFDPFLLEEATIRSFCTFSINGHFEKDFIPAEELHGEEFDANSEYVSWSKIRPFCLDLIKGKRTPLSMKFVFLIPAKDFSEKLKDYFSDKSLLSELLSDNRVSNFKLTIRFSEEGLFAISGVSYIDFSLDRSSEGAWDEFIQRFILGSGVKIG